MSKKNPTLKNGDRVKLLHMDGETSVSPLSTGTVISVVEDPFEKGAFMINVKWDSGSRLTLLSNHDVYKKISDDINESSPEQIHRYMSKNKEIIENFDWRFFRDYLQKIRDSGIVNMFAAAEFLWMGSQSMDRYFGEGREDDESFQEILELADEAQTKLLQGSIQLLEKKGKDIEIPMVQKTMKNSAYKLLELYMTFPLKS